MGLISRVSSRTYRRSRMQIFIKDQDATSALQVEPTTTVGELKMAIDAADEARLLSNGMQLDEEDASFEQLGLQDNSTIEIVAPLLGGGRKRKKKVYTTPKKIKHKRVKVKLATLKLYKVDDVGKLERKRKECPHETCGAGIFLSNHKDRQYCGKCCLTIKFSETK